MISQHTLNLSDLIYVDIALGDEYPFYDFALILTSVQYWQGFKATVYSLYHSIVVFKVVLDRFEHYYARLICY